MKSTDNKKIIITEKGNNSNVAVSVRCGCLCDSLFFEKRKIEKNNLHHHCGLDPQSPQFIANVRRFRIKCEMTVKSKQNFLK